MPGKRLLTGTKSSCQPSSLFEEQKYNRGPLLSVDSVYERVASALKISVRTVYNIKKRGTSSPGKQIPRRKPKTKDLPESLKMEVRSTLYDMFHQNNLNDQLLYSPETSTASKPKLIKANIHSNLTLECSETCDQQKPHSKWQFKPCSSDIKAIPCEKFYDFAFQSGNRDRWMKMNGRYSKTGKCSCDLEILNVSKTSTGLYRYVINNKTKRVYEVIVPELRDNDDRTSKIVINPKNITVPTNTELVIRCSVNNPSSIMWFKETDINGYDLMYDGHYYSKLTTTVHPNHILESTEYQSKLSIRKVTLSDSGVYVCVGVNEDSIKTEVNVVTVIGYSWEPHTSFSLLFLIPLAFALVPITVWLCYYRKKRKENDRQRMKLMLRSRNYLASNV